MYIAWTTTATKADAEKLARGAVEQHYAVCTQIDGPIFSHFLESGRAQQAEEYRIWFKYLPGNASALNHWVHAHHPYTTPQWLEVSAESVGEKYLSWAIANSTPPPFRTAH